MPQQQRNINRMCFITTYDSLPGYDQDLDDSIRNLSLSSVKRGCSIVPDLVGRSLHQTVTAKDIVLRRCGQEEVVPFEECYPNR